jgi:hypothetical protein
MSFSMASLLVHDNFVPAAARAALREAHEGPSERRIARLESAARILFAEAGLACADARELVDLRTAGDCIVA